MSDKVLCFVICESGLINCNILLCKLILKHKATVSIRLKDRSTSLNTEASNSLTPIADASITEVDTTAETPFSTTSGIAGMYHCMA